MIFDKILYIIFKLTYINHNAIILLLKKGEWKDDKRNG